MHALLIYFLNTKEEQMHNQEVLFTKTMSLKDDLEDISVFMQNPLDELLEDGDITKDDLSASIDEINNRFDSLINELKDIQMGYIEEVKKYV
jgi:hypothetical protein